MSTPFYGVKHLNPQMPFLGAPVQSHGAPPKANARRTVTTRNHAIEVSPAKIKSGGTNQSDHDRFAATPIAISKMPQRPRNCGPFAQTKVVVINTANRAIDLHSVTPSWPNLTFATWLLISWHPYSILEQPSLSSLDSYLVQKATGSWAGLSGRDSGCRPVASRGCPIAAYGHVDKRLR
jgi:hypothetical protein